MSERQDQSRKTATDVPFRPAGQGHFSRFICGACAKPKATLGRRIKAVLGMRVYVCAGCVAP